ncbi:AMP-binding protein [Stigmatella sp. ncwal1]|uniref:AMP-binding protein n=1 Tax=Stigmatella ashevillensis TaxID=2995309 RepID=A0ABT5DP22_9BACT|nr:AMP-binding protein [Stigmatella ashevillena]MDC0714883.1 AMP-binding protein [Stigmatella ashevillena]
MDSAGCFSLLVERHVARGNADREALVERGTLGRRQLTYGQLYHATCAMARWLEQTTPPGCTLALVGSATLEFAVAWLAAMRAGRPVLLAPSRQAEAYYPALWEKVAPERVLSDRTSSAGEPLPDISHWLKEPAPAPAQEGSAEALLGDDRPALMLMTSGSTGGAKICVHSHRAFGWFERHVTRALWGIREEDRVLAASSPHFSFGLQGLHVPLSVGATAVMVPEWTRHLDILEVAHAERVTALLAVPTLYHILWRRAAEAPVKPEFLRLSFAAGEHLPGLVRERWEAFSGSRMLNSIGTTETFLPYLSEDAHLSENVLQRVEAFQYQVRPHAVEGESAQEVVALSVDSPAMMLGYLSSGALAPRSGGLSTGDLFTPDGEGFHFVSREGDRIKLSGCWVSPHELEDFLLTQPGVSSTAAIALKTDEGLTRLRAFIVLKPDVQASGTEAWEAQVRQRMELTLRPRALRPDRIVFVESLPSTASGKIKRSELLKAITGGA